MTGRINFKAGDFEVSYEGSENFISEHFLKLVGELSVAGEKYIKPLSSSNSHKLGHKATDVSLRGGFSVSEIAGLISSQTGTDLALAAAYKLSSDGKQSFARQDILNEMQTASAYYKSSFGSNLTKSLRTLILSKQLNEIGNNTYSLTAAEVSKLSSLTAGGGSNE